MQCHSHSHSQEAFALQYACDRALMASMVCRTQLPESSHHLAIALGKSLLAVLPWQRLSAQPLMDYSHY